MSVNPESKLWRALRNGVTDVHWTRIESWSSPGVPDVNCCASFGEFWIELKVTKNNRVALSPHQISWHLKRHRFNGRSYILTKERGKAPLFLFSGSFVKELSDKKISEIPCMGEFPHPHDWEKLMVTIQKDCDKKDNLKSK